MSEIIGSDSKKLLIRDNRKYVVISREDYTKIDEYIDAGYDNKSEMIPVKKVVGVDDWYGFIDKCGNESVPLIYDYVWNFDNSGYARVKRFGHTHIVDTKGNLYDTNNSSDVDAVSMLSKEEAKKKGFHFDCGVYWPIKENNYWGIARHKTIMDEKGMFRETSDIEVFYKCDRILNIGYNDFGDFDYIAYRKNNQCILSHSILKEELHFNYDSIEPIFEFGTVEYPYRHVNFLVFKKKHLYGVIDIKGNVIISPIFDVIIPNLIYTHAVRDDYESNTINGYISYINNQCGIINPKGEIILPIEYDNIEVTIAQKNFKTGDYAVAWKNGKCSLICISSGKILFPFVYDEIIANETYREDLGIWSMDSTLLVKKNGKYGCITLDKKMIIDIKYDNIFFDCWCIDDCFRYSLILQNNGKYGTYEYYEKDVGEREKSCFYLEPQYDECVFLWNQHSELKKLCLHYIAVKLEEKWGIIDIDPEDYNPNLKDLDFKYNSIEELKQDADAEFKRRTSKSSK